MDGKTQKKLRNIDCVPKKMSFFEFCERLKEDGVYIGDDWHMYRSDGRPISRIMRNGYYTVRRTYDTMDYCFMEHRVIWYYMNGEFDESLVINHIDFDRTNNNIDNLELVTQKENVRYTIDAGRQNTSRAEDSGKAIFTNTEAQAIRYLGKNGWNIKKISSLFDIKWPDTIRRVVNGTRYGSVPDAQDIVSIYPVIVNRTWESDLPKDERIKNALLGLNGEIGELTDIFKKHFYHGHELDCIHVIMELGDIMYYLCALCIENNIDFADLCYTNADKLLKRYPDGFDVDKSLHRAEGDI